MAANLPLTVPGVRLSKAANDAVRIDYDSVGASWYALHRAQSRGDLADAPVVARVPAGQSFEDAPPPGLVFYDVRTASVCDVTPR